MASNVGKGNHLKVKCSVDSCAKEFINKYNLKAHVKSIHLGVKFGCNFCSKMYKSKYTLDNHIVASHTLEKAFQCGEFSSEFSRKPLLQRHQLVHSGERPHKCLICLKQFKENCSLKRHIEEIHTHNGSRDFVCSICQKTFVTKRILSDHAKIHGNDASKFICYFCKIRFKKRCQVEVHTRNHTHEKPYFCSAASCEYLTSDPSNLRD